MHHMHVNSECASCYNYFRVRFPVKRLRRWRGPVPGCPIEDRHESRDCRSCHAARMRRYRSAGKFRSVYDEKARARKKAYYAESKKD